VPRHRATLVPRPRLVVRLEAGVRGPVTILAAPAGWGKTTVVSAWRTEAAAPGSGTRLVAWVSLDAADNDPVRFWAYVLTALNMVQPGIGDDALALLRAPQPPPIEAILTPLLNALAIAAHDLVLVLDDYHVIEAEPVHAAVAFVLDHLPPRLHLVISTRADPPLPLARLRAQGGVTELRAADLSFTPDEAAAFLTVALGVALPAEAIAALEARSEGWIAALQLAALSVQGRTREQIEDFIAAFTGSNRYIADYLVEEVLTRQPAAIQDFVLRTAVVDRLCAALCEGLLSDDSTHPQGLGHEPVEAQVEAHRPPSSQLGVPSTPLPPPRARALLEQAEHANLFLIPLDDERKWYRYHHLFTDVLRSRLRQEEPALYVALHQRASAWFKEQGLIEEAVEHALAAADFERAASLIEQHGFMLAFRLNRFETALRWLALLPEMVAIAHPLLKVQHAVLLTYAYEAEAAEARLREAEAVITCGAAVSPDSSGPGDALVPPARAILGYVALVRGSVVSVTGDIVRALALARQGLDLIPESDAPWRVAAIIALANEYLVSGDVTPAAERRVTAAMDAAHTVVDFPLLTLAILSIQGHIRVVQGQLRQALATFREVPPLAVPPLSLANLPGSQAYEVGLGELLREWNDFAVAEEHLRRGVDELSGRLVLPADTLALGYLALARLQWARGEPAAALDMLDTFAEMARRRGFTPELVERGAAVRAQLALASGDFPAAVRWAEASGLSADDAE
jgi:LuxR family maltose regulon positive regulatory protein